MQDASARKSSARSISATRLENEDVALAPPFSARPGRRRDINNIFLLICNLFITGEGADMHVGGGKHEYTCIFWSSVLARPTGQKLKVYDEC
jgi:hypothetical protein